MATIGAMSSLEQLGWGSVRQQTFDNLTVGKVVPGRVVADYGAALVVATPKEVLSTIAGRLEHAFRAEEFPKIGDWVAVQMTEDGKGVVQAVLERTSVLSRKAAGKTLEQQVIAANVDKAFVVQAADADLSPSRIDRYIFQINAAGMEPYIVINKIDLVEDIGIIAGQLSSYSNIIFASQETGEGVDDILAAIEPGETAVLLGSSGVGKSTIINSLLGHEVQATGAIRQRDSKGRHTTTHKQMFELPGGGLLIDTPGVRELQLWGEETSLDEAFSDIQELAKGCKYNDCQHTGEPGCKVIAAIQQGSLEASRLENFIKMKAELSHLAQKTDAMLSQATKRRDKEIQKSLRKLYQDRDQ